MRCYIFNTIDLKICIEVSLDILYLDTNFQVDRIKNVTTHRILVQVWFHEYSPKARVDVLWGGQYG